MVTRIRSSSMEVRVRTKLRLVNNGDSSLNMTDSLWGCTAGSRVGLLGGI